MSPKGEDCMGPMSPPSMTGLDLGGVTSLPLMKSVSPSVCLDLGPMKSGLPVSPSLDLGPMKSGGVMRKSGGSMWCQGWGRKGGGSRKGGRWGSGGGRGRSWGRSMGGGGKMCRGSRVLFRSWPLVDSSFMPDIPEKEEGFRKIKTE